ncbi:divalent metal cation transporter FieF [Paraphotobacterium marinum]|uniref:Divalent metal cation transporter FieF n=1 Tax=Paraphotobacterium marinum TaxID=1755811 RepID=A0A220VCN1_9GAMM|nr:cation diffusion facilitator family transporter [Paraphotobacterium marinum]ASK78041.1 divalent metal cation transporter FieF [Paraphotobacterium marinum]
MTVKNKKEYSKLVLISSSLTMIVAIILTLVKLMTWFYTDSLSMLASLVDSILDIGIALLNILILKFSLSPPDKEHPYGHGKAESLASLSQAMFIAGSALFLILSGVNRFFSNSVSVDNFDYGIWVSAFTIVIILFLVSFQKWVINKTQSEAISADSLHYKADLILNIGVICAMFLSMKGYVKADAIFGFFIGCHILWSAITMAKQAMQTLIDQSLPKDELDEINEIIINKKEVLNYHHLKTRKAGSVRFIQFHIDLNENMSFNDAHRIADELEQDIINKFPESDVIIHKDPIKNCNFQYA